MKETVESRAVKVAAKVLYATGVCRYDSPDKCRRVYPDCEKCIRGWLMSKAKQELGAELPHPKKKE